MRHSLTWNPRESYAYDLPHIINRHIYIRKSRSHICTTFKYILLSYSSKWYHYIQFPSSFLLLYRKIVLGCSLILLTLIMNQRLDGCHILWSKINVRIIEVGNVIDETAITCPPSLSVKISSFIWHFGICYSIFVSQQIGK